MAMDTTDIGIVLMSIYKGYSAVLFKGEVLFRNKDKHLQIVPYYDIIWG